nr:glycosyltransferase family 9 protein [uncultured Desulfobacter sp.]
MIIMSGIDQIKRIDRLSGPFMLKIMPASNRKRPKGLKFSRILLIRPGGLGDAVLLLPVLKEISLAHPGLKIDILCEKRNQGVFTRVPYVDNIFSYKIPNDLIRLMMRKYDAAVDTEQSHFLTAGLMRIVRTPIRAGFQVNGREKLYDISLPYDQNRYETDMFRELFQFIFKIPASFRCPPPYFESVSLPERIKPIPATPFICIFPGATIEERLWPSTRWAEVIDQAAGLGFSSVLLGGQKEKSLCRLIMSACRTDQVINLCTKLSIAETARLFEKAGLLISTDSGILHLGVVSGLPTISLFGSGIAAKWAPRGKKHVVINKNLTCSPCTLFGTTPACPNHKACMMKILPEDIMNGILKLQKDGIL